MELQTDTMCPLSANQTEILFGEDFKYWNEFRRARSHADVQRGRYMVRPKHVLRNIR
jgi:hypothetical protein